MKDTKEKMRNFNRFMSAMREGNLPKFNQYLNLCDMEDFKHVNDKGETLLFYPLNHSEDTALGVLKGLLTKNINVNARSTKNATVLLKAAQSKTPSFKIIELLLKHGANINAKTADGKNVALQIYSPSNRFRHYKAHLDMFLNPQYELNVCTTDKENNSLISVILNNTPPHLAVANQENKKDETYLLLEKIIQEHNIRFLPNHAQKLIHSIAARSRVDLFELFKKTSVWTEDNVRAVIAQWEDDTSHNMFKRHKMLSVLKEELVIFEKNRLETLIEEKTLIKKIKI